jgi:hypothetical protein
VSAAANVLMRPITGRNVMLPMTHGGRHEHDEQGRQVKGKYCEGEYCQATVGALKKLGLFAAVSAPR